MTHRCEGDYASGYDGERRGWETPRVVGGLRGDYWASTGDGCRLFIGSCRAASYQLGVSRYLIRHEESLAVDLRGVGRDGEAILGEEGEEG